jgi:hypothetical protein
MKKFIILFTVIFTNVIILSQTNSSYLIENYVVSKGQTMKTKNYTQQYSFYVEKSERQRNVATLVGVLGGLVGTIGYNYLPRNSQTNQSIIITSLVTSCISTTFYIRSSINRRKAYQLKKNSYL